jgi:CBS domain-containing protein
VPDDTLLTALRRMAALDVDVLPVVDREGTGRLEGVVTEAAVFRAYERSLHAEQEHPG